MADKYFSVFKAQLKTEKEYKLDWIGHFIKLPIQALIVVSIWLSIFRVTGQEIIAGMTLPVFIVYILCARILRLSYHPWSVYEDHEELIVRGTITNIMVRPLRLFWYSFAKSVRPFFLDFVFSSFTILLVFYIGRLISPEIPKITLTSFGLFIPAFALGLFLGYVSYYTICLLMFWVGDLWSVWGGVESIEELLTGSVIPLTIHPTFFAIANVLPFKHQVSTPLLILLGKYTLNEAIFQMFQAIFWIIIISGASVLILKAGLKKVDSQGG